MCPGRPAGAWQNGIGDRPERFLPRGGLRVEVGLEDTPEHAGHVGVDERSACLVGERCDGARRVGADARECAQLVRRRGKAPAATSARGDLAGEPVEVARAGVIPESLPRLAHPRRRRVGHCPQRRECSQELRVFRHDARDLRLLEHQLRDENAIRIARSSPRQVTRAPPIPRAKPAAEDEAERPRNRFRDGRHQVNGNVDGSTATARPESGLRGLRRSRGLILGAGNRRCPCPVIARRVYPSG